MKYQRLLQQLHLLVNHSKAQNILEKANFFFIVGLGRSGTTFLSQLLDMVPECAVYHEYKHDRKALTKAYWDGHEAERYLYLYRDQLIARRIVRTNCQTYGEVNSYLRYHVQALQNRYHPRILHLVRDGRAVVTSIMSRHTFTPRDAKHSGWIRPYPNTTYAERWDSMDRFAKVCWYWAETNQHLINCHLPLVRFEDILSSYAGFSHQVLVPLGLELSPRVWEEQVHIPKNVNKNRKFENWDLWTLQQKQQFEEICGDVMAQLQYQL